MESLYDNVYMKLLVDLRNSGQVVTIYTQVTSLTAIAEYFRGNNSSAPISLAYSSGDTPAPVVFVKTELIRNAFEKSERFIHSCIV